MPRLPEIELLLLCSRLQLDKRAVDRILALLRREELDWRVIFDLAEAHRTIPLLAYHLQQHANNLLSDDLQNELHERHRSSTTYNLVLGMEVLRLLDLLGGKGITAVPFKGPVAAMLCFGDLSMRACGDVDLLVRANEYESAVRLFISEGYISQARYPDAMQESFCHEQRQVNVDMHWGIPPACLQLNSDLLWENLEPVNLLGRQVLTFSPCDTLQVLAINATKEFWGPSLHHLADIAALCIDYTPEDWAAAFHRARQIGCQRILAAAVMFLRRVQAGELSLAASERLFRHQGLEKVVDELWDHLFMASEEETIEAAMRLIHHRNAQFYYLTLTDSAWQRGVGWLKWATIPNAADRAFIRFPRLLSFLYYFTRPLRLLLKSR